jgi:hypothetical protein
MLVSDAGQTTGGNTDWGIAEARKGVEADDEWGQVNGNWRKMTERGYRQQHHQRISASSVLQYLRATGQVGIGTVARLNEECAHKIEVGREGLLRPKNWQT